jgi:hypothetical protein
VVGQLEIQFSSVSKILDHVFFKSPFFSGIGSWLCKWLYPILSIDSKRYFRKLAKSVNQKGVVILERRCCAVLARRTF